MDLSFTPNHFGDYDAIADYNEYLETEEQKGIK